jgi:hypothetical protein
MNLRSTRLRRVARKYVLERRVAQLALAKAEHERAALVETNARLRSAREQIAPVGEALSGKDLAIGGEWAGRLDGATRNLAPSIRAAEQSSAVAATAAQRAGGQEELLRQRIGSAVNAEARQFEARQAYARQRKQSEKGGE